MINSDITETTVAIGSLKPNPGNAREHSELQIEQLANSIRANGFVSRINVDEDLSILAGHGRYLALQKLGWEEVPVRIVRNMSDAQKRLYVIADNQIALNSTWNEDKLKAAVEELERELADIELTGLRPQEIDRLLADLAPEEWKDEDAVPAARPTTTTQPGDVWILGQHRVLCGDATLRDSYTALLREEVADMVFTDSPYNVNYKQNRAGGPALVRTIQNDNLGEHFEEFLHAACEQIIAFTRGAIYMCMSSSELHTLYRAFTTAGGQWSTYLIWAKDRFTMGRSDYQRQFEPILYGWKKGEPHHWCGARDEGDVWFIPKPKTNRMHPTMKPVGLVERAIRNSSLRGNLVLDPFGGSGSTLIACEKTSRRAALIELDPVYVDVIVRRWEIYTRREASLEVDGSTFTAVAAQRMPRAA